MKLGKILGLSIFFFLLSITIYFFNVRTVTAGPDDCPENCSWNYGFEECFGPRGCKEDSSQSSGYWCDPCITEDPNCPSIPNVGSVYPEASSCDSSNCGGDCGRYTFKCGTLCYKDSCGASVCKETYPSCIECTLPSCPSPLSGTETSYLLENFIYCTNTDCSIPKSFGNCYEVPSTPSNISVTRASNTTTTLGYNHLGYTGNELNNPHSFKVTVTDTNGQQDVESFSLWFTNGAVPTTPGKYTDISGGNPTSYSDTSFGIMYRKDGNNWLPYNTDFRSSPSIWRKSSVGSLSSFTIFNSKGIAIGTVGGTVKSVLNGYEFTLEVKPSKGSFIEGKYNIYAQANDKFSFTPYDNYPELESLSIDNYASIKDYFEQYKIRVSDNWKNTGIDWVVDLTDPVINGIESKARGSSYPSEVELDLNLTDNLGVSKVVLNVFGSGKLNPDIVTYNGKSFIPDKIDTTDYTGKIGHEKSFTIDYSEVPLGTDNRNSTIYINIGDNRAGTIYFVATLFDTSGNHIKDSESISLDDWIITQGNFVYSSTGIDFDIKNLEPNLWSSVSELNNFKSENADISTEMYSVISKSYRNKLVNAEKNNSYYIGDFNTKGIASSYDQLLANVQNRISRVSNLQEIDLNSKPTLSGKLCDTNCADKFYYLHTDKDLTVSGFECNGKGIITVGGNLIINPDIKNINANRDACVFLVKKNVNIKSGDYHSASKLGYDQVNAFIIADGQITLENDLGASGSRKDGLKINGSLISFNSNPIKIERFLGYSDKQFYPSVVLEAHEKYGAVLKLAFGSRIEIIKTEVGYKPF